MSHGIVAGCLVLACAFAGALRGQETRPEIYGRVLSAESGQPVAGAQVAGPGGQTTTDAEGRFSLSGKETEDPMLLVRGGGFALFHLLLGPYAHESEITVRLKTARIAAVRVVGEDGRPVRGAAVHARLPFPPAYSPLERADFGAATDQEGLAVIKDLPADSPLVVEVRVPGMIPAQSGTLFPTRVPAGSEPPVPAETLVVTPGRSLKVVVENPSGAPIPGATVNLLPLIEPRLDFGGHAGRDMTRGSMRTGTTDAVGAVAFDFLPANPVTCEVRAAGMITQLLVVEAGKGKVAPVRVKMRPDPSPPGADIPWRASILAAEHESRQTGLPVFLVMTMDGEKANDWLAGHHYHDPEIVRAAREVVPLLSSAFGEGGVGADPGHKEVDGKCTRYGTISCRVHQLVEQGAREAVMQTRLGFEVPRHIATMPSGEPVFHVVFYLSERDLLRLIIRALRAASPENAVRLARERLVSVVEDLAHAEPAARKKAASALSALANSGDEHAAALVQALPSLGVPAATRAEIAGSLRPSAITSPERTFAELVRDPDREVRRALFARMDELAGNEVVLDQLAAHLRGDDVPSREVLLRALDVERKSDALTVKESAGTNRWRLVEELVELPEVGRVQELESVLTDVDPVGRHRILRALGRRAPSDPAVFDLLVRAVKGPSPVAALRAAASAAAGPKPPTAIVKLLIEAAQSPDALLREEALRALASSAIPVDAEILAASLAHASAPVRIQAALALSKRGDRRGDAILLQAINDPVLGPEVRALLRR